MSHMQSSLASMFVLTTAVAVATCLVPVIGPFWCIMVCVTIVGWRLPAYDGWNPIVQAVLYATAFLAIVCGLVVLFELPPMQAVIPCCLMPSLAYVMGFAKGMPQL